MRRDLYLLLTRHCREIWGSRPDKNSTQTGFLSQLSKDLTYRLESSVSASLCWAPETVGKKHGYFVFPHGKTSMTKDRMREKKKERKA